MWPDGQIACNMPAPLSGGWHFFVNCTPFLNKAGQYSLAILPARMSFCAGNRFFLLFHTALNAMFLDRTVQNINRIREVIKVLLQYGFEDIVTNTQLRRFIPRQSQINWTRAEKSVFEYNRYERIRMVIEELGPTFIKLGQAVSNRPELVPEALIHEFQKLHDTVPPFSGQIARNIVESETGKTIAELFLYFDEIPVGSASIGQVHRARLLNGTDVVVKVRRPGVRRKVITDLALLRELVKLLDNFFQKNGIFNPLDIVDAFEQTLLKELDYRTESTNQANFKTLYSKRKDFYIPEIYKKYCTSRIMVSEFISGCKITDAQQIRGWGLDPVKIAEQGLSIYLTQIFEFGYFHADPHPGNVLVRPDGTIVLIDFGMVGKLNRQNKYAFAGVFTSMARQDARGMALSLRRLAVESIIEDLRPLENELNDLIEDFVVFESGDEGMGDIVARLQQIIYKYRIKMPGSIYLILRAFAILEGVGRVLHPDFKVIEFLRPYGIKLLREQFTPRNVTLDLYYSATQLSSLFYTLPAELRAIMKKLRAGDLKVQVHLYNYEPFLRRIDFAANKLAIALIISSLIIGSSIMMSGTAVVAAPVFLGVPLPSLLGLGFATLLGLALVYYMLRRKP